MSTGSNQINRRESEFLETISATQVDLKHLRKLCSTGIVDTCGIRSVCWRILLNTLTVERSKWPSLLAKQRNEYKEFVNEMIIEPGFKRCNADPHVDDHPLNPNPSSEWNNYFKDNEVLLQIDKDVRRLCPDISFFQNATSYPCVPLVSPESRLENLRKRVERTVLKSQNLTKSRSGITNLINSRKQASREYDALMEEGKEAHWEVVERILFVYAKLNPGTGYVQGMNEIIGPLYYTLASDPNTDWKEHAEADTFFCFTNLMGEIRDNFIKSLDKSESGIEFSMNRVLKLLKNCDPKLFSLLNKQNIRPQYYLFRWITLLLSQEFSLPDVIQIWDTLFADRSRFDFLICICGAMITLVREDLLANDFSHNMKLLQNYPVYINVFTILTKAKDLLPYLRA